MQKLDTEGAFKEIFEESIIEAEPPQKTIQEDNVVVGLDIGATKVVCIVGKKNTEGKIKVLGYGESTSEGVKLGAITNMADAIESVRTAVEQASTRSGMEIRRVTLGVTGRYLKCYCHTGFQMRKNPDDEIVDAELEKFRNDTIKGIAPSGEQIIDVIRQEYVLDGNLLENPIGMVGSKLQADFHIVIGQSSSLANLIKCVENVGLEVERVIISPIASSQVVLSQEEKYKGVVLVDMGGDTTDLAIFKKNKIQYVAVIPYGGNIITKDICTGCSITTHYAEEVKVKFGSALASENRDDEVISIPGVQGLAPKEISFRDLAHIIQSRLEEIFEQVHQEIQNVCAREQVASIVLTGGGALMKHIQQLAELETGLDVRIGYPNEQLFQTVNDFTNPKYATSIGLIIEGVNRREFEGKKKQVLKEESQVDSCDKQNNTKEIEETRAITNQDVDESNLLRTDSKLKGWFKKIVRK